MNGKHCSNHCELQQGFIFLSLFCVARKSHSENHSTNQTKHDEISTHEKYSQLCPFKFTIK